MSLSQGSGPQLSGFWMLTGGARSGKSACAELLAARSAHPVVFVATAEAFDDEMAKRIQQHRLDRPAHWVTVEEPLDLHSAVSATHPDACLVIDCITVWVNNLLFHRGLDAGPAIEAAAVELSQLLVGRAGPTIVVTNEVGLGLVPETPLGRLYRDTLGRVNATLARAANHVLLMSAGRAVALHPVEDLF
jgi:adenosylcobinamide kinase / adenosylcobinamide-phosphate guanylyltransferase